MLILPKAYGAIARSGYFQSRYMHWKNKLNLLNCRRIVKSLKRRYIGAIRDLACLAVSPCDFKGSFPRTRKIRIEDRANGSRGCKNA
jgi:hypothetical protein